MESDEQAAVVSWFRYKYPRNRIIGVPNGQWISGQGKRKYALISKYKREGLTNGVSDLLICVSRGGYHGLFLEMKDVDKKHGSLSPDQIKWACDMNDAGYFATWAAGFDVAKELIEAYMDLGC